MAKGFVRGENAIALIVLHLKEQTGKEPSKEEVSKFVLDNMLLGLVMTGDWEEVNVRLKELKKKGDK